MRCTTNQNRSFSPKGLYFHNRRRAIALPAVVQRTKLHLKGVLFLRCSAFQADL